MGSASPSEYCFLQAEPESEVTALGQSVMPLYTLYGQNGEGGRIKRDWSGTDK